MPTLLTVPMLLKAVYCVWCSDCNHFIVMIGTGLLLQLPLWMACLSAVVVNSQHWLFECCYDHFPVCWVNGSSVSPRKLVTLVVMIVSILLLTHLRTPYACLTLYLSLFLSLSLSRDDCLVIRMQYLNELTFYYLAPGSAEYAQVRKECVCVVISVKPRVLLVKWLLVCLVQFYLVNSIVFPFHK